MANIKELHLRPWQEVVGTCVAASEDYGVITLILESKQVKRFKITLDGNFDPRRLIGEKVAILRTDNAARPFLVRKVTATPTIASDVAAAAMDNIERSSNRGLDDK